MARRIEDYAILGDTQTVALVGRDGSIDWLCLPRFDSDACFAALLGDASHGAWSISPKGEVRAVRRRYRKDTLILETEFRTADGTVRLVDFMPPRQLTPDLVRIVEGVDGRVPMVMRLRPRFGYGRVKPWVRRDPSCDWVAVAGPDAIALHTPIAVRPHRGDLDAEFLVARGDRVPFVITWSPSHLPVPRPVEPFAALEETEHWWREWIAPCTWRGPWEEAVRSSLIVLKALTYLPTGGIVAAPTTSLPEELGGERNWDYRYCWLRDATFTLLALLRSGFEREAHAWRDWLLRAVAGDPAQVQIMYGCAGERRLTELTLPWLPGYAGSRPVRIGNAAEYQFQLDIFGEVMDALHHAHLSGIEEDANAWRLQLGLMDFLESNWSRPDHSMWEVRGPPRHFTHSRVMAWVAVDRAIRSAEVFRLDAPLDRWRQLRADIHRDVLRRGYDPRRNCFTQYYGSRRTDASLLMIPLVGFLPPQDPRVRGTIAAIEEELMVDGLIRRYKPSTRIEGVRGGEGAFLACTFWLADNLHLIGRTEDACRLFERLLSIRNDVGLLAEEYDPGSRRMLGNFPQAFSHVALVNTARTLTAGQWIPPRCGAGAGDRAPEVG